MKLPRRPSQQQTPVRKSGGESKITNQPKTGVTLRVVDFSFFCKWCFCPFPNRRLVLAPSPGCCGDHQKETGDCRDSDEMASSTFILKVSTMVPTFVLCALYCACSFRRKMEFCKGMCDKRCF
ncbi:hypothetical protein SRHO_G00193710 [Serrasalmus rhombeus]